MVLLTNQPIRFKRLTQGGQLLVMNLDLEAAQVLGAGDSFMPTNEPAYSGIYTSEAVQLVTFFIKACMVHVKRFVVSSIELLPHKIILPRLGGCTSSKAASAKLTMFD